MRPSLRPLEAATRPAPSTDDDPEHDRRPLSPSLDGLRHDGAPPVDVGGGKYILGWSVELREEIDDVSRQEITLLPIGEPRFPQHVHHSR